MRKLITIFILIPLVLIGCSESVEKKETFNVDDFLQKIYIGRAYGDGYVSIEKIEDPSKKIKEKNINNPYPQYVKFIDDKNKTFYELYYYRKLKQNEDGNFFDDQNNREYKALSDKMDYIGLYKLDDESVIPNIGLAINDYDIKEIYYFRNNEKRPYSKEEYDKALESLQKDESIKDDITNEEFENTIANARKIFEVKIEEADVELLFSSYFKYENKEIKQTFIIDIIKNDEVIKTYNKIYVKINN